MTAMFGHSWVSAYGAEPSDTWLAGLIDMTEEEIRTGLVACLTWEDRWPPTLPQFRALCRLRREPAHEIFKALPEPRSIRVRRLQSANDAISAMRESVAYHDWLCTHAYRPNAAADSAEWWLANIREVMKANQKPNKRRK